MVEFYEIYIYIFLTERINTRFLFYFIVHLIGILISRAKIRRYGESGSISLVPKRRRSALICFRWNLGTCPKGEY